ncbi:hypothetical protein GCM10007392_23190 [Saccharospirillum salsuginis]|uniref:Leukocidin/Hemolysin toxin domain-containing protein n=1 Tax=Saccharospirillum salsuginis TaxID=418750 RepID=A0A918KB70_9GAMM|nr:hypothetical protein GCM10007392_23190 [Saccharospirillum salsuginis]
MIKTTLRTGIVTGAVLVTGFAQADDIIKAYSSTLYELNDSSANQNRISAIYTVKNIWNTTHWPEAIKEVKLILDGGSGFNTRGVPSKQTLYHYTFGGDYRYTVPTGFQLKVRPTGGAGVTYFNHVPHNDIQTAWVSESISFNAGIGGTASETPGGTVDLGVTWTDTIRYQQPEFTTLTYADGINTGAVRWDIENRTIKHGTPAKNYLIHSWTSCSASNLIDIDELPAIMRSNFRPQASVLYRKQTTTDWNNSTRFTLEANWKKTHYHFARDWCSWYTNFSWKNYNDYDEWTRESRDVVVKWHDYLYR